MTPFSEQSTRSIDRIMELTSAGNCDLHLHTFCSDGSDSPAGLVARVLEAGLAVFSITDHDTMSAIQPAQAALNSCAAAAEGANSPLLVPGVELSVDDGGELHLLGYFPFGGEESMESFLREQRLHREIRNQAMLDRLAALGYPISASDFQKPGDAVLGRMQVALLLVRDGYFKNITEVFDQLLGDGLPGYMERPRPSLAEAIHMIRTAGGAAVLAHPALYGWCGRAPFIPPELIQRLLNYRELGLQGVEAYHGEASVEEQNQIAAVAQICGLTATCGSDDHGTHKRHAHMYRKGSRFGDRETILVTAALVAGPTGAGDWGIMLTRRSGQRSASGKWEFPGGKFSPGETGEACLSRELFEELGVRSTIGPLITALYHDYAALRVILLCYETTLLDTPVINPDIHDQLSYFTIDDARQLDLLAADIFVLDELARVQKLKVANH
jgi:predicted metal-dependent phosphoesterase TrpH/8-oxo-dGTP pyrophosphatase MutT (NUDIX family)